MLTDEQKKQALSHLNEICPDTFDEGEFGPWKFTDLARDGARWTLAFENRDGADRVSFEFAGDCVDDGGIVVTDWFEQINARILEWESEAFE
ncbi:MAG: hypothetical protein KF850_32425 [Labilithrix sp.]|nr:hypothetical protein [Labilithrix sp.]